MYRCRPARMYHAKVILSKNKVTKLTESLLEDGFCQLKETETKEIEVMFNQEMIKDFNGVLSRYNFVFDSLEKYKKVVQPESLVKSLFLPKAPVKHKVDIRSNEKIIKEVEKKLELIEPEVREQLDRLARDEERINKNKAFISNLRILPEIKTDIYNDTDNIKILTGISNTLSFEKVESKVKKLAVIVKSKIDKARSFIAVFASPEKIIEIEKVLHEVGFDDIVFPYEGKSPKVIIKDLEEENNRLVKEIKKIKQDISKLHQTHTKELTILKEQLEVVEKRIEALRNFKATSSFSIIEAWVPARNLRRFSKLVERTSKRCYMEIRERCDAPTMYNNPSWFKPFEIITSLYSPPKYKKFDPTILLAFTFTIFFGLMLTDFVYGVIMAVLAFFVYRGMGRYDKTAKSFSMLLIYFGISAAIWGIIFGSYFGDIIQRTVFADQVAAGMKVMLPLQVIDPMTDIMIGLGLAITIGALHLFIGLAVGFVENMREKDYINAFMNQGVWIVFMVGCCTILGSFTSLEFPFLIVGLVIIGISVVMQVLLNFVAMGPVLAVLSIFGFSGFFGDLFSYARLIALALGTSGIALGVNFMCLLLWEMFSGKSLWITLLIMIPILIIFVLGHVFNVLMNGLGAFVHTTRLHFLEHFSKYYEGDGKEYTPFYAERKKTVLMR